MSLPSFCTWKLTCALPTSTTSLISLRPKLPHRLRGVLQTCDPTIQSHKRCSTSNSTPLHPKVHSLTPLPNLPSQVVLVDVISVCVCACLHTSYWVAGSTFHFRSLKAWPIKIAIHRTVSWSSAHISCVPSPLLLWAMTGGVDWLEGNQSSFSRLRTKPRV